jgi:hypothetical protein
LRLPTPAAAILVLEWPSATTPLLANRLLLLLTLLTLLTLLCLLLPCVLLLLLLGCISSTVSAVALRGLNMPLCRTTRCRGRAVMLHLMLAPADIAVVVRAAVPTPLITSVLTLLLLPLLL